MKHIKTLTPEEVKQLIPQGAIDAINSDPKDVVYCPDCDGMRRKDHRCPFKEQQATSE